jgi:hypothetical protein
MTAAANVWPLAPIRPVDPFLRRRRPDTRKPEE